MSANSATLLPEWLDGIDPAATAGVQVRAFLAARAAYHTAGRHYHTWQHILACLHEFREMSAVAPFDNPRAVLMALLFHDAVYLAGSRNNEPASAALAKATLEAHSEVPPDEREDIARMILLTANHHAQGAQSEDARRLLDIDLAVLGADWPVYEAYARGIRREFVPVVLSLFKFRLGRLKFLESVAARPRIFHTEHARARREIAARANIAREITALSAEAGWLGRMAARLR